MTMNKLTFVVISHEHTKIHLSSLDLYDLISIFVKNQNMAGTIRCVLGTFNNSSQVF